MGLRLVWARAVLKPQVAPRAGPRQTVFHRPAALRQAATPRVGFRQAVAAAALFKRSAVPPVAVPPMAVL
jgi:hypothetical protein